VLNDSRSFQKDSFGAILLVPLKDFFLSKYKSNERIFHGGEQGGRKLKNLPISFSKT
jgi:hypothetical protein